MYRQLYPQSKSDKFSVRIFSIFDEDGDDSLDFAEFMRAIRVTMDGNVQDKLKCAFAIYDLKGDGKIDKKEMKKVLNQIYDMFGEDSRTLRRRAKIADKKVDLIFDKFDVDGDNSLSLDEFVNGCLKDEHLKQILMASLMHETGGSNGTSISSGIGSSSSNITPVETNSPEHPHHLHHHHHKYHHLSPFNTTTATTTTTTTTTVGDYSNSSSITSGSVSNNYTSTGKPSTSLSGLAKRALNKLHI